MTQHTTREQPSAIQIFRSRLSLTHARPAVRDPGQGLRRLRNQLKVRLVRRARSRGSQLLYSSQLLSHGRDQRLVLRGIRRLLARGKRWNNCLDGINALGQDPGRRQHLCCWERTSDWRCVMSKHTCQASLPLINYVCAPLRQCVRRHPRAPC